MIRDRDFPLDRGTLSPAETLYARACRAFACFGLMSLFGSELFGFRSAPDAAPASYGWNLALYAAFITPHLVMTRSWFKRWLWGNPAGSPRERRVPAGELGLEAVFRVFPLTEVWCRYGPETHLPIG